MADEDEGAWLALHVDNYSLLVDLDIDILDILDLLLFFLLLDLFGVLLDFPLLRVGVDLAGISFLPFLGLVRDRAYSFLRVILLLAVVLIIIFIICKLAVVRLGVVVLLLLEHFSMFGFLGLDEEPVDDGIGASRVLRVVLKDEDELLLADGA